MDVKSHSVLPKSLTRILSPFVGDLGWTRKAGRIHRDTSLQNRKGALSKIQRVV